MEIMFQKTENPKEKPDESNLSFGKCFSDHMFIMDYEKGKGWYDPRIVPYGPLEVPPSMSVFHYGQAVFEGMKAYKGPEGQILLFRPEENMKRLNISNDRICIPEIDEELCLEAIKELVNIDRDWVPGAEGTSLYIRPFIIATDPALGLKPSNSYKFIVILSPVGVYYPQGINPVNIYVETKYIRAIPGGTGFAKTCGNYAASMKAQAEASEKGFIQVLWTIGERPVVQEVGSMNVFFKIDGQVITPELDGSILPGITRDSVIRLLKSWDVPVVEKRIYIDEIFEAAEEGKLEESFGTGTAAVISPIGGLNWEGREITINNSEIGGLSEKIYDNLTGIQTGKKEDPFGWIIEV